MKLQDLANYKLGLNVANLINECSPDDVYAVLCEDDWNETIEIVIDPDADECVNISLQVAYEQDVQIYLADEIITDAGNLVECHIHIEHLTVEELIAECFSYCKRHGCLPS